MGSAAQTQEPQPSYGTMGVPSPTNTPGGRMAFCTWSDAAGNLWLFGGVSNAVRNAAGGSGYLNDMWRYDRASGEWTWVGGSNNADAPGVYGVKGQPAPGNWPGARWQMGCWTDENGNFWLFGGVGVDLNPPNYDGLYAGDLDDLWRYDPVTGEWTWMSGYDTFSSCNATVTPVQCNDMPSYGALGVPSPGNVPGARFFPTTWTDGQGNLWMFGGQGADATGNWSVGQLNDLWRYNIASGEWTWMSGSSYANSVGQYGTRGVASPENAPGSRESAVGWADGDGYLWLFGGIGRGVSASDTGPYPDLNDLWRYDIANGEWTWVGGSKLNGQDGNYGAEGVASPANWPGARDGALALTGANGGFWLFGGDGFDAIGTLAFGAPPQLNDLWRYDPGTGLWTWMAGSNLANQAGTYGTMGVSATGDVPGARLWAGGWADSSGALWIYGGVVLSSQYADLWKYQQP
ncbi:MAG: kelch repeat-containing protein [Terriglobales bacterium]